MVLALEREAVLNVRRTSSAPKGQFSQSEGQRPGSSADALLRIVSPHVRSIQRAFPFRFGGVASLRAGEVFPPTRSVIITLARGGSRVPTGRDRWASPPPPATIP